MKLLILMMSCNKDHFVKQSQISKESLRRQIEHHKLENEIVVYDYVGDAESNHIDDSTIYLKTDDDMDHTFDKTYDCIQFINSQNIDEVSANDVNLLGCYYNYLYNETFDINDINSAIKYYKLAHEKYP